MRAGDIELLRFVLSKGVDVDSQSDSGTPLIWAAGHDQPEAVKLLLENGADVSVPIKMSSGLGLPLTFLCQPLSPP